MTTRVLSCVDLDPLVSSGRLTQNERAHACRLQAQVRDAGGSLRDQNLALIHELDDLDIDVQAEFDGAVIPGDVDEVRDCVPDFLRHSDADLEIRSLRLASARTPIRIIWLLDLIDTFTHELIRLDSASGAPVVPVGFAHTVSLGSDLARRRAMIRTRCTLAYQATDTCAAVPRFTTFVAEARRSILEFLVRTEARSQ